jgi:lipoprotein-anchoring transpeptidase ErfK/SrfK
MSKQISRRDFLKLAGAALGGLAFSPFLPPVSEFEDSPLVRVATTSVSVYSKPTDESRIVRQVYRDQILPVYEEVNSGFPGYNPVWYRVWGGFVHRARMPKVQVRYNAPAASIRENGQLGEVTVPFTQAMFPRNRGWEPLYRLYYETVHWVVGVEEGPDGQPWYRLLDELLDIVYNVPARHIRLIADEEITPLSPEVPWEQKRVHVDLKTQQMTCYEYDQLVFQTSISSGRLGTITPANGIPTRTPAGSFNVRVKMPSKHMGDGNLAADVEAYELAGVPWTVFFTAQGHAFHGTYWHDNYGVPMSSGCINMRNHEAKWFFRWCLPSAGADEINPRTLDKKGYGTPILITN